MSFVIAFLANVYSKLLLLYPVKFQDEFAEEMQVVFRDSMREAVSEGILSFALVCLRELGGMPVNILRECWHEFERRDMAMVTSENEDSGSAANHGASTWDAILGVLPFALFGLTSLLAKIEFPFRSAYLFLAFYAIVLFWLFVGLIRGVLRWTYSYLGWSGIFAWWWTGMSAFGVKIFGHTMLVETWGWRIWFPLFFVIGLALLWTRSIRPLRELAYGIWQDWTLLSLAMYALAGLVMTLYDENHSPYLFAFMIASTLVISGSVWLFMKSTTSLHRFMALLSGFVAGIVIDRICEFTWNFAGYYGLPRGPAMPWYETLLEMFIITGVWMGILFWPALVGFVRNAMNGREA